MSAARPASRKAEPYRLPRYILRGIWRDDAIADQDLDEYIAEAMLLNFQTQIDCVTKQQWDEIYQSLRNEENQLDQVKVVLEPVLWQLKPEPTASEIIERLKRFRKRVVTLKQECML